MAPKKAKKVALGAFLADETTGTNWADDADDFMPTAPGQVDALLGLGASRRPGATSGPYGGRNDSMGGMQDRDSRPPRPDVPFPTQPPYTAYLGNMSFESNQDDVRDFFGAENLTTSNIRMVNGYDGKPKGFCYVEFPEADMLRHALTLSGSQLGGRTVRVSVAEAPRGESAGRSDGDWTRSGPLAALPGRSGSAGGFRQSSSTDRFATSSAPPSDSGRDWGDARGSKFAPSQPASPALGSGRSTFGDRREPVSARMGGGFGAGSRDREASAGSSMGTGSSASPYTDDGRDWNAMRGSKFTPSQPPTPSTSSGPERRPFDRKPSDTEGARDWRARPAPSSPAATTPDSATPTATPAPAAPTERKKLQLTARTASGDATEASSPAAPSSRSNIFGGAAPVDTAAKEAEISARLVKEREAAEQQRLAEAEARKAAAAEKPAVNPFGSAKPVDVTEKEKEVEEKLAKDKEELNKRMQETKVSESNGAAAPAPAAAQQPAREWRRPVNNANGHGGAPQPPRRDVPGDRPTSTQESVKPVSTPKQFSKDQAIRKEGFSYSNIAGKKQAAAANPEPSPSAVDASSSPAS